MAYRYPYGNTEQMNLDWFLKKFRELQASWDQLQLEGVVEAAQEARQAANEAIAAAAEAVETAATISQSSSQIATNTQDIANLSDTVSNLDSADIEDNSDAGGPTVEDSLTALKGSLNSNNLLNGSQYYRDNLFNPVHSINNRYMNTNNGYQITDNNYFATGYIPVSPNTSYKANFGRQITWYDSNKSFINGVNGTGIQTGLTSPSNAAYLRISFSKANDTWSPMFVNVQPTATYNETIVDNDFYVAKATWLQGKRLCWYGDSIVAGNDFDELVASHYGIILFDNGINGSTMGYAADGTNTRNAIAPRIINDLQYDIIIVSGGTNDFEYAWQPMGSMANINGGDITTFYGAVARACRRSLTAQAGNLIVFTTPIKRGQPFTDGAGGTYTADGVTLTPESKNKYGYTLGDYADVIKEVCAYYSIPVLDLYNESQLNPCVENQQVFFDDALTHPNTQGQKIMARRVIGWLNQIGADMDTMSYA